MPKGGLFPHFEPVARVSKTPFSKIEHLENPTAETKFDSLTATWGYPVKLAERGHSIDVTARSVVFNHRNRR